MLKDYKTRVEGTYKLLVASLDCVNENYAALRSAISEADKMTATRLENPFPLRFENVQVANDTVHFLGYKPKVAMSDISGADRVEFTHEPLVLDIPRYDSVKVSVSVAPPVAYLIPQQWGEVISRLRMHGILLEKLDKPIELEVELYKFSDAKWQERPYEGRHPVTFTASPFTEKRTFPAGTIVAWTNQRAARVLIHALEPQAPDAFVAWGFFDALFEQKEYGEDYVLEKLAAEMLQKDPKLKEGFNAKVKADTAFAHAPYQRLNFFYQHSPYWDKSLNVYPVARLMKDVVLPVVSAK
jgi:hypothetical protein